MENRHTFLVVTWALLLGFFAWSVRPVLTPIVLLLALAYLIAPLFGSALYRRLMVTLGTLTALWLVTVAGSILTPFVLALVLAYIAHPLVDRFERRGIQRGLGALFVLLGALLVILLGVVLVIPVVIEEGAEFLEGLPVMIERIQSWYRVQIQQLSDSQLPILRDIAFERALEIDVTDVNQFLARWMAALRPSWETAIGLGRGLQTVLTILGYLVLTPVLTFYLLRDYPRMERAVIGLLPRDQRGQALGFLGQYDRLLGEYLRGQLLVALFVGVGIGVGFWLTGFPNAVLLGVLAGVFNIVPYLGFVVSLLPALVLALLTPPIWLSLVKLAVVFLGVQTVESYMITPRIIGKRVGLHPVWVMLAIIAGGTFFGLIGLLIAIPITVLIKLFLSNWVAAYKRSVYYRASSEVREE